MDKCECKKCLTKEVKKLRRQVDLLMSIIHVSADGNVTLGSAEDPVDAVYTTTIGGMAQPVLDIFTDDTVAKNFANRGICLDDQTATFGPSPESFPAQWLGSSQAIQNVRTYHYSKDSRDRVWVKWLLLQKDINVMIGITLESAIQELDVLSSDYVADTKLFDGKVLAIAVGNDVNTSQVQAVIQGITYATGLIKSGRLPNVLLTSVLLNEGWLKPPTFPPAGATFSDAFKELVPSLGIISFNLYDAQSTSGTPLPTRLSWNPNPPTYSVTLNGFAAIRFAMQAERYTLPFWCAEVGWQQGIDNLKQFYTNYLGFNMSSAYTAQYATTTVQPPDRIFYFTVRDVPAMSETYGLYEATGPALTPKFSI